MKFTVLTLFPELIETYFQSSIAAKAVERGLIRYEVVDIRSFAQDRHRTCDDAPYGGGAGMVMKPDVVARAIESIPRDDALTVYPSPSGYPFNRERARRLAAQPEVVLICGRYEGLDQRVIDTYVDLELSIGDYVISSGELAAMVIIDGVFRLIDGVISSESLQEESFEGQLLEYPQYTRPEEFAGQRVPEVLLSGHHERIRAWRRAQSIRKTAAVRPDLLARADLSENERQMLRARDSQRESDTEGESEWTW